MITKRELMERICRLEADVDFILQSMEAKKVKKTVKRGKKSETKK